MSNPYHSSGLHDHLVSPKYSGRDSRDIYYSRDKSEKPPLDIYRPQVIVHSDVYHPGPFATKAGNNNYSKGFYVPPLSMNSLDKEALRKYPYSMNGNMAYVNGRVYYTSDSTDRQRDESQSPEPQGIERLFTKYADRCSMNGIPIIKGSKNPKVKAIWWFLLIVAIGVTMYHLASLVQSYLEFKTHSQITLTFSRLEFPAVTICNVNAMRFSMRQNTTAAMNDLITAMDPSAMRSLVKNWEPRGGGTKRPGERIHGRPGGRMPGSSDNSSQTDNSNNGGGFFDDVSLGLDLIETPRNKSNISSLYKQNYKDSWQAECQKSTFYNAEEKFREIRASLDVETQARVGHQIDDMLISCSFSGGICTSSNFTRILSSTYGNCYTIQYDKFISQRSGPSAGMDLVLFLESNEYIPGITNGKGIQLVIHEQGTMPFPDEEGIAVGPGTQTIIGLRKVEVNRMSAPYGQCVSSDEFYQKYKIKYTRITCQKVCEQEIIKNTCKCYDEMSQAINAALKISAKLPPCRSDDQMVCLNLVELNFDSDLNCTCDSPCREVKYEKTVSSRQWPSLDFASLIMDTICRTSNNSNCLSLKAKSATSYLSQEFIKLSIYYEDLNYENLAESADYEITQFLSDFGGTLGLYIGLSVLGICELIHLLVEMCVYLFYKAGKRDAIAHDK